MKETLSPKELAHAIGVSESSLKRWVDQGLVSATRTAGGHRRITVQEAIRFIRTTRQQLVHPEMLGISGIAQEGLQDLGKASREDVSGQLTEFLRSGAEREACSLIVGLFLNGTAFHDIIDGPVRSSMNELGALYLHDENGIFIEHRATEICVQAVRQIRLFLDTSSMNVVALGGAPSGDPYQLPTLCAATTLASEGLHAVNLGPDTPLETILKAVETEPPGLVWLSVSHLDADLLKPRAFKDFVGSLRDKNIPLAIGGSQADALEPAQYSNVILCQNMVQLGSFARGMMTINNGAR